MISKNSPLLKSASYINGEWIQSVDTFAVKNPSTGDVIAEVQNATADDALKAVDAAVKAMPDWAAKTAKKRARILRKWFDLIMQNQESLARILTAEQGKPLTEAMGEIAYGANYIEWFAEEAKRIYGDVIPSAHSDQRIVVTKQPVGVVSAITPWNFPSSMITRKAAPALAAGCSFIIKAAAETPLSALALAELAEQAGIPKGIFNVLASDKAREIGKVLTQDTRIAKFSFTGSTPVGRILLEQCASTIKKTTMELGGNAPFIVFEDANLDQAVAGLMMSKYRNAGQTCVCTNRVFIQSSVYDAFAKKLITEVKKLSIGDGFTEDVDIGPLIHSKAANDIDELVQSSVSKGAEILIGGKATGEYTSAFYPPTVLGSVTSDMPVAVNEIFGPVAPLIKFDTEEQVLAMANETEFGLASYFYARDLGRVWRVSEGLEYGMVGINTGMISNEMAPFGGIKQSGTGREGSKYGINDYIEIKYLCMAGVNS